MLNDENPRYRELANEQFCGCGMTFPRCKEDCYWYEEWQDMGAHIPHCRRKRAVSIEPKDCENCEQYHSKYRTTNADKIRQKSDEELAKWCNDYNFNCPPVECKENGCERCWLEWLKQEAK